VTLAETINPFARLRERLGKLLTTNGTLAIICGSERSVSGSDSLGWLPVSFGLIPNSGTTLEVRRKEWEDYFSGVSAWTFHFQIPAKAVGAYSDKEQVVTPLAVNRAGEYLGLRLTVSADTTVGALYLVPGVKKTFTRLVTHTEGMSPAFNAAGT